MSELSSFLLSKLEKGKEDGKGIYLSPTTLSHGCTLEMAFEARGIPKPEPEPKVKLFQEAGVQGHQRILKHLGSLVFARDVFFEEENHRIKGYADALLYIPESGFYVLEIKTTGSLEFSTFSLPREDHSLQLQIYIWGIETYYPLRIEGGFILYENRDNLGHKVFFEEKESKRISSTLGKVKSVWNALSEGHLPEDKLSKDHWWHKYCPYREICEAGREALEYQRKNKKPFSEKVLGEIVSRRVMEKRQKEKSLGKKKKSLEELAWEFNWE